MPSPAAMPFLSISTQASTQLAAARALATPAGPTPQPTTPLVATRGLAATHDAVGKLLSASTIAPDERAGSWMTRAATSAREAIVELDRAAAGRPWDAAATDASLQRALHEVDTGQRMVTSPPSSQVYDGS